MHAGEPEKRQRMQARDNMGENNSNQVVNLLYCHKTMDVTSRWHAVSANIFSFYLLMDNVKVFLNLFRINIMVCMKGMSKRCSLQHHSLHFNDGYEAARCRCGMVAHALHKSTCQPSIMGEKTVVHVVTIDMHVSHVSFLFVHAGIRDYDTSTFIIHAHNQSK